jgi:hypothetical protein
MLVYEKPEVTQYSGAELIDLMGPVETAYCEVKAPESVVCEGASLAVDFSDIPDFTEGLWTFREPSGQLVEVRYDRESGSCGISNSTWTCKFAYNCNDTGEYKVTVKLIDGDTATCSDKFEVYNF